jgi:predicted Fe-Mo cluster-binding NifX family protein
MILCTPVTSDGLAGGSWGRASKVALATAADGKILDWKEFDVGWDALHDEGTEGSHHSRVARFLIDHNVEVVVAEHMGPGMAQMVGKLKIRTASGARGDARASILTALGQLT